LNKTTQPKIGMIRQFFLLLAVGVCLTSSDSWAQQFESEVHDYTATAYVSGLENVWGMAFLPNGDMLVTERPGRLRMVRNGSLVEAPITGTPTVHAKGQGGLLDVALHPDFATNGLVYLSYSKPVGDTSTTAVARGRLQNGALVDVEDIFVANSRGGGHYGSRLVFDNDGYLFVSVGDRQAPPKGDLEAHPAQDISNHHGTINRMYDDGRIPEDNPFVNTEGAEPSIWSYGHRNPQGLVYDRESGRLWNTEHGPQGGDELNLVKKGANYGWPVVGQGVNYGGDVIHETTKRAGMESPVHYWVPSIATAGALLYTGSAFPNWAGNIFVGGLVGQQLARVTMDGTKAVSEETLYQDKGRIRDIEQGPDGSIYLGIDAGTKDVSIVRLTRTTGN
jgi:glucose/arabinose dehydrogenase